MSTMRETERGRGGEKEGCRLSKHLIGPRADESDEPIGCKGGVEMLSRMVDTETGNAEL